MIRALYSVKYKFFFLFFYIFSGCFFDKKGTPQNSDFLDNIPETEIIPEKHHFEKSKIVQKLDSLGLIDVYSIDTLIIVDLKYSTSDNFTGQILYEGLSQAYFQPEVAKMLSNARKHLQDTIPATTLLIYDAARPLSIQKIMLEKVKNTPFSRYIAHPEKTSLHNYGAAVDLTIIDRNKNPFDMGTPFDYFGKKAGNREKELLAEGLLTPLQVQNRQLLRYVMKQAGFSPVSGEWWHFNAFSLEEAKRRYDIIE